MKDYTLDKNEREDFVLSYEIKDDKIIIKYANGKLYETKYARELEKDILNKMKNQVENSSSFKRKLTNRNNIYLIISLLGMIGFCCTPFSIISKVAFVVTISTFYTIDAIKRKKLIEDYKKNKCFVRNIELFQNGLKEDMGTYVNLNTKTKQTIKNLIDIKNNQVEESKEDLVLREPTINTIDKISTNTFCDMYELLLRNQEFEKYYETSQSKQKVLTKKNEKQIKMDM